MKYPRTITIVAVIPEKSDLKDAEWIWENHKNKVLANGIRITKIGSGDFFEKLEKAESKISNKDKLRDIHQWYNQEREDKIKELEARVLGLEKELEKPRLPSYEEMEMYRKEEVRCE